MALSAKALHDLAVLRWNRHWKVGVNAVWLKMGWERAEEKFVLRVYQYRIMTEIGWYSRRHNPVRHSNRTELH
jgi:hypothetical protein